MNSLTCERAKVPGFLGVASQCPFPELTLDFPAKVWMVEEVATGKWFGRVYNGEGHLFCSSGPEGVMLMLSEYASRFHPGEMALREMSFDEARAVALSRPSIVVALRLVDDPAQPVVHYVR